MKQKDVFLQTEGDAWFERNLGGAPAREVTEADPLLTEILALPAEAVSGSTVLEIGCGDGARLAWLQKNRGCRCHGLDPSSKAVDAASKRGLVAVHGTADELPFADRTFDIVMFGFCLYLCDREDLFRIAAEADRVLKNPGWLLILDFHSPTPSMRTYHHRAGVYSYKMDYRTLFTWNPAYVSYSHKVGHHSRGGYTDDADEWIATSVLRKNFRSDE